MKGPIDEYYYWRFAELKERGIVNSRTDLHRKQQLHGFPMPVKLGGGKGVHGAAAFRAVDVIAWLKQRESQ